MTGAPLHVSMQDAGLTPLDSFGLLGRMAVAENYKGKQLGRLLLMHALDHALEASKQVASWAVVVDAREGAREFYFKHDFQPLPDRPQRLFLPLKTVEERLQAKRD